MISLLFESDFRDECEPVGQLDDLMIGRILAAVTPDIRLQSAAREVLERPLSDPAQAEFRREIVRDFAARKLPVERLSELFGTFADICNGFRQEKSDLFRLFGGKNVHSELLKKAADTLQELIELIYKLYDLMRDRTPTSKGLNALKNRIAELSESQDLRQLYNIAINICNFSAAENVTEVELIIDGKVKISGLGIVSTQRPQTAQKRTFGRKPAPDGVRAAMFSDEIASMISASAGELCEAFEYVISSICDEFMQVYYDINFYVFAVRYCDMLKKSGVPLIYAGLCDETDIENLYDLFLLFTLPNSESVVPNDFKLSKETNGILVLGKNSSGKTVYLRAAAMALIFTAAGLPIPAYAAKIALPKKFLLQVASAERAYHDGDITGRFEEEVIEIKKIVDVAEAGTLVLLNEVFQTTDYTEGAEGLHEILKYLNEKGAKWVLVTHLRRLDEMAAEDNGIVKLSTDGEEKFKVSNQKT